MSIYREWGFSDNPFQTNVLPPSELGRSLLVGRENEWFRLRKKLENPPRLPTIEGLNGVGKSSLVNVASFDCYEAFLRDPEKPMLLPCRKLFQLNPQVDLEVFVSDVYHEVVQTLIEQASYIEGGHIEVDPAKEKLDRWLNSPLYHTFNAGGAGASFGYGTIANLSDGFSRSGFIRAARGWLEEIFPTPQEGAVVCVIDNLELLQTSEKAREQLEALRDELLSVHGLRWVLCGALGIVLGVAASPRLEGVLEPPIEVGGVESERVTEVFNSRIETFRESEHFYIPIMPNDFQRLYRILFYNLRSLLGHIDSYCQWVAEASEQPPISEDEKARWFEEWLREACQSAYESANSQLKPRAWEVFEDAIAIDGSFSPSDYEDFRFNSVAAFRPHVRDLEAAGLVVSTQDEGDKRRKTIQVTPKGWLVQEGMRRA
ncbi:winged helix DNA-binding protein [Halorhodospira neutriphila]|uniref:winged helix DNA-binding protein n=1 Tax=Halorhodospira neutriphila TaxID=168379 RepID=UPI0019073513|nr:winged helix DNA-binding protein [Halorhodospira neutriphila]